MCKIYIFSLNFSILHLFEYFYFHHYDLLIPFMCLNDQFQFKNVLPVSTTTSISLD